MLIEGKKIIVTGSASGMGEATLKAYVQAGANVVGMDVSDDTGSLICEMLITLDQENVLI